MIKQETFERMSPAAFAEKVGIPLGWFVISSRYFKEKSKRRHAHGKWFKISSPEGSVCRILRFSPNLKGAPHQDGQIVIDWVAWLDLNGRADEPSNNLELTISPVSKWQVPFMATQHPDPSYRLAGWLALLSVGLGLISVMISLI